MGFFAEPYRVCALIVIGVTPFFACSVNNMGAVKVTPYENVSAYCIELETWGFHLSTHSADAGLSMGDIVKTCMIRY
jgi:hypothetical protein